MLIERGRRKNDRFFLWDQGIFWILIIGCVFLSTWIDRIVLSPVVEDPKLSRWRTSGSGSNFSFIPNGGSGRKGTGMHVEHEMNPVYDFRSCHYPISGISGVRRDSADTEKTTCFPYTYLFNLFNCDTLWLLFYHSATNCELYLKTVCSL